VLRHFLRSAIFLIPMADGGSVARALDFTVANFSSSAVLLSEVRDGHDEGVHRIDSGHPYSRKTLAGAVWRVRRAEDGRELCRLVTRETMTIVSVDAPPSPSGWRREAIAGFTVMFSSRLTSVEPPYQRSRQFIEGRLGEIVRSVPSAALADLRGVGLWLDADSATDGGAFFATWPSNRHAGRSRGYDGFHGAMYQGVVFPNVLESIDKAYKSQPMLVLHELSHGYHHRVLGTWNAEVRRVYKAAKDRGLYRDVRFSNGSTTPLGHAGKDEWEYFAELSEAYFGQNDQTPLNRSDLKIHDLDGFHLIEQAWQGGLGSIAPVKNVACGSSN
jgi:hypothetical protein